MMNRTQHAARHALATSYQTATGEPLPAALTKALDALPDPSLPPFTSEDLGAAVSAAIAGDRDPLTDPEVQRLSTLAVLTQTGAVTAAAGAMEPRMRDVYTQHASRVHKALHKAARGYADALAYEKSREPRLEFHQVGSHARDAIAGLAQCLSAWSGYTARLGNATPSRPAHLLILVDGLPLEHADAARTGRPSAAQVIYNGDLFDRVNLATFDGLTARIDDLTARKRHDNTTGDRDMNASARSRKTAAQTFELA